MWPGNEDSVARESVSHGIAVASSMLLCEDRPEEPAWEQG